MLDIRPLLEINEAIVGFCFDALAIVELSVHVSNQHHVYRAQYRVAETLMPAVTHAIMIRLNSVNQGETFINRPRPITGTELASAFGLGSFLRDCTLSTYRR